PLHSHHHRAISHLHPPSPPPPPTTATSTPSLHDALPISGARGVPQGPGGVVRHQPAAPHARPYLPPLGAHGRGAVGRVERGALRSEEHTSELQSRGHLVCRLLLEKKKIIAREAAASSCGA